MYSQLSETPKSSFSSTKTEEPKKKKTEMNTAKQSFPQLSKTGKRNTFRFKLRNAV